jgi:predicted transcriptional regulator of viral defense system
MAEDKISIALKIVKEKGMVRPRELAKYGIAREYLQRMVDRGLLEKAARGLYRIPNADFSENISLAEAGKKVPNGIVCLLSALQFHNLTTAAPHMVWMAVERTSKTPKIDWPPMKIMKFSGQSFDAGIEEAIADGVRIRVYNPAKTVADCFKYRNKVGLDVALEALRDCKRQKKCSNDKIWHYAEIDRVSNIMRPYLEAIT